MASFLTDEAALQLVEGNLDWVGGAIKVRLVASSATPLRTATAMTGLTAIGTDQVAAGQSIAKNTTDHRIKFDATDPVWTAVASGVIRYMVWYLFNTNDAGSLPIFVCELPSDVTANGSDLTGNLNSSGINYLQM